MNIKLSLCLIAFVLICSSLRISNSYILSDAQKLDQILINSLAESKHLAESDVLDSQTVHNSIKTSESKALNDSQTIELSNRIILSKKTNSKQKSCFFCSKEKQLLDRKEEQYKQRLEYIKQQILSKLGMSEPPKHLNTYSSNYMQILEASSLDLTSSYQSQDVTTKPEPIESDKLFIFPTTKRQNTPQFNISIAKDSFDIESIKKITLYAKQKYGINDYIVNKELIVVSKIPVNGVSTRFQDISNMRVLGIANPQIQNDSQSVSNWLQYDLTQLLKPEVLKVNKLVSFDSENFNLKDSFITVEQHNTNIIRSKRSIDCTGNTTSCCRESFYVNFTTIGWDNWIVQPLGYNANFCKGKCDISNARYHHTSVVGTYPSINLCCSPREMSHISLIYLNDNNGVFKKILPNMVVESCDCA